MNANQVTDGVPGPLSGSTRLYAILGDPIEQVGSPGLFNPEFRRRGIDAVMMPMHVFPTGLLAVIDSFRAVHNFDGLVITVPHKIAAVAGVDELGVHARRVGAVNAIRKAADGRLIGDNFDGEGFVRGLAELGHTVAGCRVLMIGAGGAGCAVGHAIATAGASALGVFDIESARCRALVESIGRYSPGLDVFEAKPSAAGYELIVNCTSVGMHVEDPLPVDLSELASQAVVADIILKPRLTPLLLAARARGCAISCGKDMLKGQIDVLLDFFGAASNSPPEIG